MCITIYLGVSGSGLRCRIAWQQATYVTVRDPSGIPWQPELIPRPVAEVSKDMVGWRLNMCQVLRGQRPVDGVWTGLRHLCYRG